MKIPKKLELQQIVFNHSFDIDFRNFMNIYKKYTAKQYHFLIIDCTLALNNPLHLRENLFKNVWKITINIVGKFRDEKLQYDIKKGVAKTLELSSGKID